MIIDYAWNKPTIAEMTKAGVTSVGRYIGQDNTGKNMTRAEVEKLNKAGIDVWTIFEFAAAQATGGKRQAKIDGELALQQIAVLGQPHHAPVYFAVDFDIPDYAPHSSNARAKLGPVGDYFEELQNYLPLWRIGAYGGYWLVSRLHQANLAEWFMQTGAWSPIKGGKVTVPDYVNIYQPPGESFGKWADMDLARLRIGQWTTTFLTQGSLPGAKLTVTEDGQKPEDVTMAIGETLHFSSFDLELLSIHQ